MGDTSIEWTDATWNPVRGCSRVSAGCEHCYAERQAARFSGPGMPYEGLVRIGKQGPRWTGVVRLVPDMLDAPLHWRKPRRVFVNSMSDLFHESLTDEQIAAVFGVMAAAPQHTFQVLTKRARRMREWFAWASGLPETLGRSGAPIVGYLYEYALRATGGRVNGFFRRFPPWPFPNVHLGVSVEDQATADERIPELLACPAAVRWVSYEPALGPVDFSPWIRTLKSRHVPDGPHGRIGLHDDRCPTSRTVEFGEWCGCGLDWIVVGGESGPGARPFDLAWARSTIAQCREAGVPAFAKQLGALPFEWATDPDGGGVMVDVALRDRKGGDMREWPTDLRVRMWPGEAW